MGEAATPDPQYGSFEYVAPTPESVERIKEVRAACEALYLEILAAMVPCRQRSLALTKLEEVSMWANKGIVFNQQED